MCSKNPKPSSKLFVSTSSEESSSSNRSMDDTVVICIVTADNPTVSSGRDVGLHAGNEIEQFFKYPENVDVAKKFLQYKKSLDRECGNYVMNAGLWFRTLVRPSGNVEYYQVPSLDRWRRSMDIGDDIDIVYYNRTGAEVVEEGFLYYLNQVAYGLSIPLTFFPKGEINALRSYPGQLNGNIVEMMRVCESLNQKWRYGGIARQFVADDMFVAVLTEPNPKATADTSSLFDVVSREGNELNKVLGELGIRREKRLNSVVEKVHRAHKNRTMAAFSSTYADVMEISAYAVDIRASSKGISLEAVEQEALDLATRDPIRLDTQIRSSISQLSVAWKSVAEEKALQKDKFEKEAVVTKQKVEDEAKKAADITVASRNKLIQAFYFRDLSREDIDLALTGKYAKIVFPGDDASLMAEQTPAPPVADNPTKEGQRAMRILFFNIKKEDRKIHAQLEIDLGHAYDELKRCKGHNACLEREKVECAWLLQSSEKRVTLLEVRLLDTQQHLQVSQSRLKKKIALKRGKCAIITDHERQIADVIVFYGGELVRVENKFRRYISRCGKDVDVENHKVENIWFAKGNEGGGASTSKPRAEESEEEEVEDLLPHTWHKIRQQEVVIFNKLLQVDASSSWVQSQAN
ncbi:hypothetical protein GIB67_024425 [Kingdonia uniflora]|uniref:Uncharacterized protein n=1 Tax=Kingdonia uniflora TaxID=39325 RepID=A0A7J7P513_9MAGN|nr:hypothetical protein GIB67_024425 [Kingdonia uniflora]